MLIDKIKKDYLSAMKDGNKEKKLILSTLIGEIQRKEPTIIDNVKTWTDEQVIKVINNLVESNKETGKLDENEIISIYLPTKKSVEEMKEIIVSHITENNYSGIKDMGKVMNFLSSNYTGLYDGKEISNIVKITLN